MSSDDESTPDRIVRAAYELLVETQDPSLGMGKIGRRAGVSRQAVYLHFASRADLLLALVEWTDREFGLHAQLAELAELADPRARLRRSIEIGASFEPKIESVVLVLEAARHSDEPVRAAWDNRMQHRREQYGVLFVELGESGRLRDGVDPHTAAEIVWNLTSPGSYRNLVRDCDWSPSRWAEWVMTVVDRTLLNGGSFTG